MDYYTNVIQHKGKLYVRGIENSKQISKIVNYQPYLFLDSNVETGYKTVYNKNVKRKDFASIFEAREFIKKYDDVDSFNIYGLTNFQYTYIYDNFNKEFNYNSKDISVTAIDIENSMKVPCDIATAIVQAPNEITAITISRNGNTHTFGLKDFVVPNIEGEKITYHKCDDEKHLLKRFIDIWNSSDFCPDVITGWNIEFYDIPYLINRIIRVLGEQYAKRLSPWGILKQYEIQVKGKICSSYEIVGVSCLDYMQIYKKFILKPQEKYSLDHISFVELGEKKLDYSGYDGLDDLYRKNHQMYIEYNQHDVRLISKLEAKLKLIELVFTIAYIAKVNYQDCMSSVRKWDVLIHNYLMDQNIVVEPMKRHLMNKELVGGYVREPITGMHKWVVYFDLTSLYPHLMMSYNISPEKFVQKQSNFPTIDEILGGIKPNHNGNAICANGVEYDKNGRGFLPAIMKKLFADRKTAKNKMLKLKQQKELLKNSKFDNEISKYDNLQGALKVVLNEGYGALANIYNRWFSLDAAEAITTSGQLAIRWAEMKINQYFNKLLKTENYEYVFYTDTDSAVVRLDKLVNKVMPNETDTKKIINFLSDVCDKKLNQYIADSYEELSQIMNMYEQGLHMKLDSISDSFCIIAKKKYLMNVYNQEGLMLDEPVMKMTGIQAIQSSTPQMCKDALKKSFNIIMSDDQDSLQKYIKQFKDQFKSSTFEEIANPGGINSISSYSMKNGVFEKGTPFHVKGAMMFNELIKKHNLQRRFEEITDGDKIKFCYLREPNPYHIKVIASSSNLPPEFGLDKYIDYDAQFEKTFLKPLNAILKTIDWSVEKKTSLDDLFI